MGQPRAPQTPLVGTEPGKYVTNWCVQNVQLKVTLVNSTGGDFVRPFQNGLVTLLACLLLAGCSLASELSDKDRALMDRIDRSLARAADYLVACQSKNGGWFSTTYGALRKDPSITPHVLSCLHFLPDRNGESVNRSAYDRGVVYLAQLVLREGVEAGTAPDTVYTVYLAAEASRIMVTGGHTERRLRAQQAWLKRLRSHHMVEPLGWKPGDQDYGGWGYAIQPPRKPSGDALRNRYDWANLSATMYGMGALRSAHVPPTDPVYAQVRVFVERCQNFEADVERRDLKFDDGGFFFAPYRAMHNKAGAAGRDRYGRERFHSYGSTTADGLRCLLHCGLAPDHPRVRAAWSWLQRHYAIDANPGAFDEDREHLRKATYYYYVWSLAHVVLHMKVRTIQTPSGPRDGLAELAGHLMRLQREDGTWVNEIGTGKEDDPLVATPFAASALAICRYMIAGPSSKTTSCRKKAAGHPSAVEKKE